jgi:hypothetical protein
LARTKTLAELRRDQDTIHAQIRVAHEKRMDEALDKLRTMGKVWDTAVMVQTFGD